MKEWTMERPSKGARMSFKILLISSLDIFSNKRITYKTRVYAYLHIVLQVKM
jgi:hypothetical protein